MMEGGPFRAPRPGDGRAASRHESTHRQLDEEEPKATHRTASSRHAAKDARSPMRFIFPIITLILVLALAVAGWFLWSKTQASTGIDTNKYQAVFFTNGQVYFGKLQSFNGEYMKLTDIYYLQSQQAAEENKESKNPQQTSSDQGNVQLIKLGDEIHGPEDEMIVSKEQVLFYENLKADGKVAKSIEQHKSTKQ